MKVMCKQLFITWSVKRKKIGQGEIPGQWKAFQVMGDTRVCLNVQRMS